MLTTIEAERKDRTPGLRLGSWLVQRPAPRTLLLVLAAGFICIYAAAILPLRVHLVLSLVMVAAALVAARQGPSLRLLLIGLSLAVSFRYIWWRGHETLIWYGRPLEVVFSLSLFAAELYYIVSMVVSYFQTSVNKPRKPVPLSRYPEATHPWVDVFIPTYNEDVSIVRRTALGALAMSYKKKRVYILDDGRRPAMRALAEEIGCNYMTRSDNFHAKAGNLNRALEKTKDKGELIAIFDADHVPVAGFLNLTVGFFLENKRLSLVQTPHYFYNPDPFERNLYLHHKVPNEGQLFYQRIQRGIDFWNGSFFCGSCAVVRRTALEEVGGVAVETVTEDAHTSLKMHARGWDSAYLGIPMASGLAAERYSDHVSQRIRWSRGMAQILRTDFPLMKKGLAFGQRLAYFSASFYFLFGLPRLIFILAPATYLIFDLHPLIANAWEVLLYVLPHLLLSWMNGVAIHQKTRHSFWPEVFEVAIAPYTMMVTTLALFNPDFGKFNVTAKGVVQDSPRLDWRTALPILAMLAFCATAFFFIPARMSEGISSQATVILVGFVWNVYSFIVLFAAAAVALERPQRRQASRVPCHHRALVKIPPTFEDGTDPRPRYVHGRMVDLSEGGARFCLRTNMKLPDRIELTITSDWGGRTTLDAHTVSQQVHPDRLVVGARFDEISKEQTHEVIRQMFCGPDTWLETPAPHDNAWRAFLMVLVSPWVAILRTTGLLAIPGEADRMGPERALQVPVALRCTHCTEVQQQHTGVCGYCGEVMPDPSPELAPSVGRRWVLPRSVPSASVMLVAAALTLNVVWDSSIMPVIASYDVVPRSVGAVDSSASPLTPLIAEAKRLEDELHAALERQADLPGYWSKRLWSVQDRLDQLGERDLAISPDGAMPRAFKKAIQDMRVIERANRLGAKQDVLMIRILELHRALDELDSGLTEAQLLHQPTDRG